MITWPTSPRPPPPMARTSMPFAARPSASTASEPGWLRSWTTNWLATAWSSLGPPIVDGDRAVFHHAGMVASLPPLPSAVERALRNPAPGHGWSHPAGGYQWHGLEWGDPADPPMVLIHGVTSDSGTF